MLLAFAIHAVAADEPTFLAVAKGFANQLQLYLDHVAQIGGRPDFSTPPVSQ